MLHLLLAVTLEAQAHFSAGLTDLFGYVSKESAAEFVAAEKADPSFALAHWGEALARGTDLNTPLTAASFAAAQNAIKAALPIPDGTSDRDRLLIAAVAARYAGTFDDRVSDEKTYRAAMEAMVAKYPADDDAAMLLVEDLLEQQGMHWNEDGTPLGDMSAEILKLLQTTLARSPRHLFANHLCIHAYDNAPNRTPAIACAQMLDSMMFAPPLEHLAHVPAHLWMELGDGKAALASSERAWNLNPTRYAEHDAYIGYAAAGLCGDLDASYRWLERIGALAGKQLHQALPADLVTARDEEEHGRFNAALQLLQKSAAPLASIQEMIPYYPADVRIGALYFRAGRYADAAATFDAILKQRPRDPRALFGAAETFDRLGDPSKATRYREQFAQYWCGGPLTMRDF